MTEEERDGLLHTILEHTGKLKEVLAQQQILIDNLERYSGAVVRQADSIHGQIQMDLMAHREIVTKAHEALTQEMRDVKASLMGRRTESWALLAGTFALLAIVATLFFAVIDMNATKLEALTRLAPPAPAAAPASAPLAASPPPSAPAP